MARVEAVGLLDLRNHLVRPVVEAEVVDVAAPQERGQRAADVLHRQTELRGELPVDHHRRLRQVVAKIVVDEEEHSAFLRFLRERGGHSVQLLEGLGGLDDELHRKPEGPGQRRRLEQRRAQARDVPELLRDPGQEARGGRLALVPGLEHHPGERLSRDVELEHVVGLRVLDEGVVDLARVELALLQRRVRRGLGGHDEHALVFRRSELLLRCRPQKVNSAQDNEREHGGHRHPVERAMEKILVAAVQRVEAAIEKHDELGVPAARRRVVRLQELRAHHGRERQRDHRRHGDRPHQGDGELGE